MILIDIQNENNGMELIGLLTKFRAPFEVIGKEPIEYKRHLFVDDLSVYLCYGPHRLRAIYDQEDTYLDKEHKLKDYLIKLGYEIAEPKTELQTQPKKPTLLDEVKEIIKRKKENGKLNDIVSVKEEILKRIRAYSYYAISQEDFSLQIEAKRFNKPHIIQYLKDNGFNVEEVEHNYYDKALKLTW